MKSIAKDQPIDIQSDFHRWLYDLHGALGAALTEAQDGLDKTAIELAIKVQMGHSYNSGQYANPEMALRGEYRGRLEEVQFLTHLYGLLNGVVFCLNQGVTIPQTTGKTMDTLWEWYEKDND